MLRRSLMMNHRTLTPGERGRLYLLMLVLFVIPVIHVGLLHGVDNFNSFQGVAVQALRPLGTVGAAAMLLYMSLFSQGRRRVAWALIANAMFFSVLYSTLKITFDIDVTVPFMRVIWFVVYISSLSGGIAYIPPKSWSSLRNILSTLRVVVSCAAIDCAFLAILYSALILYDPSLSINDTRIVNLPNFAFDIVFVFVVGLVCRERPAMKLVFLCILCIFIDNVIHIYMSITMGFYAYQGRDYLLFPLNTLQSIILAFAAYHDAIYRPDRDITKGEVVIGINEWLTWAFFPLISSLIAFLIVGMSGVPRLYPLFILLSTNYRKFDPTIVTLSGGRSRSEGSLVRQCRDASLRLRPRSA